ncbi:MAG: cob(I)yrinic acid a,c-diamide adenosyltransferase [Vampirovibrionales bacterium]|nr:cob(I)yrinic acid a,c-diamide adenosyltransferase [Vampirovibrionales bacterium]
MDARFNPSQNEPFNMLPPGAFETSAQQRGYIHVYTGLGKGKTTASLGLTLRALGRGFRVLLIMFAKGGDHYGELFALRQLRPAIAARLTVVQAGLDRIVFSSNANAQDAEKMRYGWALAKRAAQGLQYDLLVMDEANIALDLGFIDREEMLAFLCDKPPALEIVLTGRRAHPDILAVADLVSDVQPLKHYWQQGVRARPGIEY